MAFEIKEPISSNIGKKSRKIATSVSEASKIFHLGEEKHKKLSERDLSFRDIILCKFGSIENLRDQAAAQDSQAQWILGCAYEEGIPELGIEKNLVKATDLLESAMINGERSSVLLVNLATLHDRRGTIAHQRRAYKLYLKAAKLSQVLAQVNLAEMYRCGVEGVVDIDTEEAFKWYRRAAGEEAQEMFDKSIMSHPSLYTMGNTRKLLGMDHKFTALKSLYKYYMCGDCPEGEPQQVKALYYLKKAAELGDPEAQKDLGLAYLTGESGHPKDLDKAKRWLGKAAQNGEQQAQQVLDKFDAGDIVDSEPETGQAKGAARQYADLMNLELAKNKHPYSIQEPMVFHEDMFTEFPDSPTAQRYLKAFRLMKKGLEIIIESKLTDPKGITLLAQGYLYENSIRQSFPLIRQQAFVSSLFDWIDQILESHPLFFEGLVVMSALQPSHDAKFNFESCKLDLRRTIALRNVIHLIKKAEPDKQPKEEPYNFEEDYTSWLHVLYYLLGSNFIITECYKDGAEAFDMALKCCPNYYEAKLPLGHCLMNLKFTKQQREYVSNDTEKLLEMFAIPENQRIFKEDYLSWTDHQLKQRARELFIEYLKEAPECDNKYQDGYYHLAVLYLSEGNVKEAVKWKEKGEDSEEKRLPFLETLELGTKKSLAILDAIPTAVYTKRRKYPGNWTDMQ